MVLVPIPPMLSRRPGRGRKRQHRSKAPGAAQVVLQVNGRRLPLQVEPRTSLLDALREQVGLMDPKRAAIEVRAAPVRFTSMDVASRLVSLSRSARKARRSQLSKASSTETRCIQCKLRSLSTIMLRAFGCVIARSALRMSWFKQGAADESKMAVLGLGRW